MGSKSFTLHGTVKCANADGEVVDTGEKPFILHLGISTDPKRITTSLLYLKTTGDSYRINLLGFVPINLFR